MYGVVLADYLACLIALFKWKKWGFFVAIAVGIAASFVNVAVGLPVAQAFGGLIWLLILYGVLQIGGERKGWSQLD